MPEPNANEKESEFIARCVPIVMKDNPKMDNKQAVAVCFSTWREKRKKEGVEQKEIIIAENVKLNFNGDIGFIEKNE